MTSVVGHERVRRVLEHSLPSVALMVGPPSVGKRTLATHLLDYHRVAQVDRFYTERLTVSDTREIARFIQITPYGEWRTVLIQLEGAHERASNALLKALEEPPPAARFILLAEKMPMATLASRAHVFRCGLLRIDQVEEILKGLGLSPAAAHTSALVSKGHVVVPEYEEIDIARARVLGVVKAIADHDMELFVRSCGYFDETARRLLTQWLDEALTHRWAVFSEIETFGLARKPKTVKHMIWALSAVAGASARIAVRVALESIVKERN